MACDKPNPAYCGLPQVQLSGIGQGPAGRDGASAYDTWLSQGNVGTVNDFLAALKGPQGANGPRGVSGPPGLPSDALPVVTNGKDGAEHPIAYFTGARFSAQPTSTACDKLALLGGSRRLELGAIPFPSGTYLMQLNLQFGWTGTSGDLNGNCWVYQDETPLFEIDWARLHRGTGLNLGTVATLNDAFVAELTQGSALSIRASSAFTLVGGSVAVFGKPNYVIAKQPEPSTAGTYRYVRLTFEYYNFYQGYGAGNDPLLVNNIQVCSGGSVYYPTTAMTSAEEPTPFAVSASTEQPGYPGWKAFTNVATPNKGWMFRPPAVAANVNTFGIGLYPFKWISAPYVDFDMGEARAFDKIFLRTQADISGLGFVTRIWPLVMCVYVSNDAHSWRPYWRDTVMSSTTDHTISIKTNSFSVALYDSTRQRTVWPDAVELQDEDGYWYASTGPNPGYGLLPVSRRWIAVRVQYNTNAIAADIVDVRLDPNAPGGGRSCGQARGLAGTWVLGEWKTFDLYNLRPSWQA